MHVKPEPETYAYAQDTIGSMISRAKDTHTPNRVVRVGGEWEEIGEVAGPRMRAELVRQFFRWYLRYPGAKLPARPPRRDGRDTQAGDRSGTPGPDAGG